jgi:uncharacterized tellurite resistance protein B-like protein
MNILKRIFRFSKNSNSMKDEQLVDPALFLLYEISKSDGSIDDEERKIIKMLIKENLAADLSEESTLTLLEQISEKSSSLYPTIREVNESYNKEEKIRLLSLLMTLIVSDGQVRPEEEALFFKIAELIKIKRTLANKIRLENS